MPGFVLHVGASVLCLHAGQAQPTMPNPRVTVMGMPTVTMASPYLVAACSLATSGLPFCVNAQWVSGATRLTSNGQPLLLMDSQAVSAQTGNPLLVLATQSRTSGM